jgi:multiple antibiotic resistance protein
MPVINPIGTAIILLSLTPGLDDETRKQLAKKISVNTLLLLLVLLLGGRYLLGFFGISVPIVQAVGGFIVMSMGLSMLNESDNSNTKTQETSPRENSSLYFTRTFYPYTFPLTVGPGGVAVSLTLSAHNSHDSLVHTLVSLSGAVLGIVGITLATYFSLSYANRIVKKIGPSGVSALSRLMAFIVVCIGAEISWTGIQILISQLK